MVKPHIFDNPIGITRWIENLKGFTLQVDFRMLHVLSHHYYSQ